MYVKYKYRCNWKQSYQKKIVVGLLLFSCLLYLSILENYRMPTNYTEIAWSKNILLLLSYLEFRCLNNCVLKIFTMKFLWCHLFFIFCFFSCFWSIDPPHIFICGNTFCNQCPIFFPISPKSQLKSFENTALGILHFLVTVLMYFESNVTHLQILKLFTYIFLFVTTSDLFITDLFWRIILVKVHQS